MIKIHRDVWNKIRRPIIDISRHIIVFCINLLALWIMTQLTDLLFPNIPLVVKALAYLSETALVIHFAKDSF